MGAHRANSGLNSTSALTPPSSGQLPAGVACLQLPLMSNVRLRGKQMQSVAVSKHSGGSAAQRSRPRIDRAFARSQQRERRFRCHAQTQPHRPMPHRIAKQLDHRPSKDRPNRRQAHTAWLQPASDGSQAHKGASHRRAAPRSQSVEIASREVNPTNSAFAKQARRCVGKGGLVPPSQNRLSFVVSQRGVRCGFKVLSAPRRPAT